MHENTKIRREKKRFFLTPLGAISYLGGSPLIQLL